jgi:hypothetical protein
METSWVLANAFLLLALQIVLIWTHGHAWEDHIKPRILMSNGE